MSIACSKSISRPRCAAWLALIGAVCCLVTSSVMAVDAFDGDLGFNSSLLLFLRWTEGAIPLVLGTIALIAAGAYWLKSRREEASGYVVGVIIGVGVMANAGNILAEVFGALA